MQDDDTLLHFGEDHFIERYQRYKSHIAEWHQQYPKLAAVDLRYEQQVVLEMTPGTNAVAAKIGDPTPLAADSAKPSAAQPADHAQAKPKPEVASNSAPNKPAPERPAKSKPSASTGSAKPTEKTVAASTSKPQSAGAKTASARALTAKDKAAKAARDKKKRTEAKRATLNASKRKPAPTHPAAAAAQGQ
jgi:cell division protein FtsQ